MSKLKFNFQSLDLYNRLNPRSKITRNKNNTFEDETTTAGAGATASSISGSSSSKSTKSCTTTPILNRVKNY
jgi:hypothetical protein